jgi:hypothetical protein
MLKIAAHGGVFKCLESRAQHICPVGSRGRHKQHDLTADRVYKIDLWRVSARRIPDNASFPGLGIAQKEVEPDAYKIIR